VEEEDFGCPWRHLCSRARLQGRLRVWRQARGPAAAGLQHAYASNIADTLFPHHVCPLIVGVDTIAGALARVNNGNPITPDFEFQAPRNVPELEKFEDAFEQLSNILGRNESASSTPQNVSPFTTPPQQITSPINPQFSPQSAASSRSNESGREPNSSLYAIDFVRAAYRVLTDELKKVAWFRGTQFRIKAE